MSPPVPPHYTAFRIVLVLVLLAALAAFGSWLAGPAVLAGFLEFLGLR